MKPTYKIFGRTAETPFLELAMVHELFKRALPLILVIFGLQQILQSAGLRRPKSGRRAQIGKGAEPERDPRDSELASTVKAVDAAMLASWQEVQSDAAPLAPEHQVLRRLALALMGTVPSVEELRALEAIPKEKWLETYLAKIFSDARFADNMAERLARATVGDKDGPFIIYRRRRYVRWLSEQLSRNLSMAELTRQLIGSQGFATDKPATNFLNVEYDNQADRFNEIAIAGRLSRAFLGLRMDCAECHDHPFESWKREDFHGLAAFFGEAQLSLRGLRDDPKKEYVMRLIDGSEGPKVAPKVPFQGELLPPNGPLRNRLSLWLTDVSNEVFARAWVNRVWALMFGRPLIEPVDDMPLSGPFPAPLEVLAQDFARNNHDLRRLITVIARSRAFQLDSRAEQSINEAGAERFAIFPLSQLRPEQVIGAVIQSSSLETIDRESFWLSRFIRVTQENDFLRRYGDLGEDRFESGSGTIPQRLLFMNGRIVHERTEANPFSGTGRIAFLAPSDESAIDMLFLSALTRHPKARELEHFKKRLAGLEGDNRAQTIEDIRWSILNSTEASWQH